MLNGNFSPTNYLHKKYKGTIAILSVCCLLLSSSLTAHALTDAEKEELLNANRALPIQSNEIENWPQGPVVGAQSAILMEAETGTILYAKNIHQKQYPASTTKILTALMVTELCEMDEMVTFSHDAVFDVPWDGSKIAMDVGQAINIEECLQAILIRSANEVCFAVAEHLTGTTDWTVFGEMMTERAAELGCLNSHFMNPNGLPDENHYTTCYDLAMIGRQFFANELLCNISLSRRLEIPASDTLPEAKLELNSMEIIPTGQYAYDGIVGCKTGYTDAARYCLVSAAERNGMKLICVVLRDERPYQYEDTISLFDYGFSNFEKVNVANADTKYNIQDTGSFYVGSDVFGNSQPLLSLDEDDYVILPKNVTINQVDSQITYETDSENQIALITYSYNGVEIGSAGVNFTKAPQESDEFETVSPELSDSPTASTDTRIDDIQAPATDSDTSENKQEESVIFVNVVKIFIVLGAVAALVFFFTLGKAILRNYQFTGRRSRKRWRSIDKKRQKQRRRKKRAKHNNKFRDYDF